MNAADIASYIILGFTVLNTKLLLAIEHRITALESWRTEREKNERQQPVNPASNLP